MGFRTKNNLGPFVDNFHETYQENYNFAVVLFDYWPLFDVDVDYNEVRSEVVGAQHSGVALLILKDR